MRSRLCSAHHIVHRIVMLAIIASMLAIPVAIIGPGQARASDGFATQTLISSSTAEGGGQVAIMRIVIEPGVALGAHKHPGTSTFVVVSGALQTRLMRGGASISRSGIDQVVPLGAFMNVSEGQAISYSSEAVKTLTNHGSSPLVLMATMLLDPDQPAVAMDDGTSVFQFDLDYPIT